MKIIILVFFGVISSFFCKAIAAPAPLIPMPQKVEWEKETFRFSKYKNLFLSDKKLERVLRFLPGYTQSKKHEVASPSGNDKNYIYLELGDVKAPTNTAEAYQLSVNKDAIHIKANTEHGVFNALQTLSQLINNKKIQACIIEDFPAFSWRGYMIDVGRNYQSVQQIKEQIDVMAKYKLNVFHFHLTENVAWRLQIKKYPQLTNAESMTRNKGSFYTAAEMHDLIQYCSERNITLVPELDMPGHSEAFKRAMGFDMQTPEGIEVVKNIIREFTATYDLKYLHIGADEVHITNKDFLPEVEKLIDSCGKQLIVWDPGASRNERAIRHLWKPEEHRTLQSSKKYIESQFLYFSDMDPQNTVVTMFNRRFFDKQYGDNSAIGAQICLWNDRKVSSQEELLSNNAAYPALVTFGERSWRGGGYDGVYFCIGEPESQRAKDFKEFEDRLLAHKKMYFADKPFHYVKQTHIQWKLFGPFPNSGDLEASFWPEEKRNLLNTSPDSLTATGGAVWLWHTHYPAVKAWLPDPKKQTTWYAYTRFWSSRSETIDFWIDFKDQSKSGADATPQKGEWDYNKSKIWINDNLVAPPVWKFPGRPSGKLEEPLVDEMYYMRPPHKITVKKGWNTIFLKLPVDQFDPLKDWQEPPKFMFTVIPVTKTKGVNWEAIEFKYLKDKN